MRPISYGDPVPWFTAPTSSRPNYSFATVAGRYVVLCFLPSSRSAEGTAVIRAVAENRSLFQDTRCAFFGATADPLDQSDRLVADEIPGVRWFYDTDAAIARSFGTANERGEVAARWFLLDPMLRVMTAGGVEHLAQLMSLLARLPAPALHAGCEIAAPVLLLPRVFEPALCRALIELYDRNGGETSGFMQERDGKTVRVSDPQHKIRADCTIDHPALRDACQWRIRERVVPEIAKAFQFKVTRMERYIVACYRGDERGHFAAHRDNTTKGTAHRRFAVTLNLNAEEYDGGELRFPEFGSRTYKPPTGGTVIFSCSLLHEALPVTRGARYVFLPFLYDDAAAAQREANNPFLDASLGEYQS
jgi:peroxiredoxin